MLLPFSPEPEEPGTPAAPEMVPTESLSRDAIEAAEAEIEAEENEWPATA